MLNYIYVCCDVIVFHDIDIHKKEADKMEMAFTQ